MDKSLLVFDTETTGLDVWGSTKIFAIGWIFVNPRTGEEEEVMHRFDADSFRLFKKRAEQADAIIAHNLKYDMSLLWKNDYLLDIKKCHDTLNMAALLVDEDESKSELALSLKYLGYRGKDHIRLDDWLIKHRVKNNPNYMNIPWNIIEPYTKVQLEHTGQLFMMWEDVINKEYPKAYAIEQKMPKVLMKMEKLGVLIDTELLEEARGKIKGSMKKPNSEGSLFETEEEYDEAKDTLLDEMVELDVPYNFNPSSNFDVADFLISKGVSLDKTPTGNFKTDVYSLKQVKHPLAALVLEWRRLQKISSTYIDGLLEAADVNGVIHTNYRQNGARTGRLSSNNPNLQNQIGGDNAESEIIKRAFIPRPGYTNISFDYSGMELLAGIGLSGDEVAIKLLKEGHDFHDETLQLLLKYIPTADRTKAKGINFSWLYGAGFAKVQQMLNAPDAVVRAFLNGYAAKFPQLLSFAKERVMFAERERFVSGVYNRHYRLREEEGGYKCLNYLIQGGCATVMKDAMLRIDEIPHNDLLLQIHDEAVLQVEKGYEKEVIKEVVRCMEEASAEALPLTIPVDVELWSPSWANKTEVAV